MMGTPALAIRLRYPAGAMPQSFACRGGALLRTPVKELRPWVS